MSFSTKKKINLTGLKAGAKTVRSLSIDAIEKAGSGHPGLPLGCAEIGTYLFAEVLKHNPSDSDWINRDRFILSAGHGSMLLYSLLYLTGYGLTIDDIKNFRQFESLTPGHPEYGLTKGVETSTGPLGQGVGNGVGMAIAGKINEQKFNRDGYKIFDNRIFVLAGDGDLMEGISHEACSLAGHLKLNNLIVIYDNNKTTIDSDIDIAFTENVEATFIAMDWHVIKINGHDFNDIKRGFDEAEKARISKKKPVLIMATTIIGKGAPNKQGTSKCHGSPLGKEESKLCKEALGIDANDYFYVDKDATSYFNEKKKLWQKEYDEWQELFRQWCLKFPELKEQLEKNTKRIIPDNCFTNLPEFKPGEMIAIRSSSNKILNAILKDVDFVISGSADLSSSVESSLKGKEVITNDNFAKHNIQYGVREHAMGAIANGLCLYGNVIPIVSTFLSFITYMLQPIRMSAMMKIPVIYLFSHDSIYIGEDGPTHQPVEHISILRLIPDLNVMRPCDPSEIKIAWEIALKSKMTPSAIITARQKVPTLDWSELEDCAGAKKGGYIIKKEKSNNIDIILISSGSEISITLEAAKMLEDDGYSVRVVSMMSMYLFEKQDEKYKASVLPQNIEKRFVVEAGVDALWYKYIGLKGKTLTINRMGFSGKPEDVASYFGFNKENIYKNAKQLLQQ